MKKILTLLFVFIVAFSVCACNNANEDSTNGSNSITTSQGGTVSGAQESQNITSQTNSNQESGSQTNSQSSNNTSGINSTNVQISQSSIYDETTEPILPTNNGVTITSANGYQESASLCFNKFSSASGYNVYYLGGFQNEDDPLYKINDWGSFSQTIATNCVKIDNELIRDYGTYMRADFVGLKNGYYTLVVAPIISNAISYSQASYVNVKVYKHIRDGFAFSENSPAKTASGAYNEDGTLKTGAQVLYVTDSNFSTISLDVIKDNKGTKLNCVGLNAIMLTRQKGYDKTPLSIRLLGKVDSDGITDFPDASKNYLNVKGTTNVTIEGIGDDATTYGWSFLIRSSQNIEIRNLGIMRFKDDGISIDTDNNNIWIHNIDFFYGDSGSDADQVKGDGSMDMKLSNYITVSFNHFWDSGKASLCGMKEETADTYITYHHNWFDHSDSRHPRIRTSSVHVYNNYFDGVSKYGIGVTMGSSCFAESNYFYNTKKPLLSSMQGTDAIGEGTFTGEAGGIIKAYNNVFINSQVPIDYASNKTSFDCYTVQNRNDTIPQTVKTLLGATTYNNFDTNTNLMYNYTVETAESAKTTVTNFAGRCGGGDVDFAFTAADNLSSDINTSLSNLIINYSSKLVSVGGGSI